ncbi:MAG: cyclopropane-fatty-acyl-phospholipid synthase family protein [Acidobacteriota bacterium]
MNPSVAQLADRAGRPTRRVPFVQRFVRRLVHRKLAQLHDGVLHVCEIGFDAGRNSGASSDATYGQAARDTLEASVVIRDPAFYPAIAFGGSIGAAEAFMDGLWETDDLTAVMRLMVRNRDVMDSLEDGIGRVLTPVNQVFHRLRANTRSGARRNIEAHYDLSNDFFALFLDPTMMYSSAVFERSDMTLEAASTAKLERLCAKLDLGPDDHLLEIGTGWGGMAIHAAREHGCRVTTTTISPAQYAYARRRIEESGLGDRITVLQSDFRDLQPPADAAGYTKIVSIEMIEAIGDALFPAFFDVCSRLLLPSGRLAIQSITIADRHYESARRSVDFIKRYIFPGSTIPAIGPLIEAARQASDLTLCHLEDIGPHYADTLRQWRLNIQAQREAVRALGFSERFARMWLYYLCYCEGGFAERQLGDAQMVFVKPLDRGAPVLGALAP